MTEPQSKKLKLTPVNVGILGCTGAVGQRFIQLLQSHPYFNIVALGASERSAGVAYSKATAWRLETPLPEKIGQLVVSTCEPKYFNQCALVFSALDSSVATEIESNFVEADIPVFSNAKNHRMDPDVPLIVPLVNSDHFDAIPLQRAKRGLKKGFLVCNANCSTTGLVVALKPIHDKYQIESLIVTTMQAISGAGYPGVSSMDIMDNVVPYISGEEDKLETEPQKILGKLNTQPKDDSLFTFSDFDACASCNRVPVLDGHTEAVVLKLKKEASVSELEQVLSNYTCEAQELKLPSAPESCILVSRSDDRPQPRLDRMNGNGYSVTVGRIRSSTVMNFKFTLLSHNTILGAAGSAILNAELALSKGYIS